MGPCSSARTRGENVPAGGKRFYIKVGKTPPIAKIVSSQLFEGRNGSFKGGPLNFKPLPNLRGFGAGPREFFKIIPPPNLVRDWLNPWGGLLGGFLGSPSFG